MIKEKMKWQGTRLRNTYTPLAQWFGRAMYRLTGWKAEGTVPDFKKSVVVAAPHTTNWDIVAATTFPLVVNFPTVFMMKDDWFFWPLGRIFKWMGGIPVNRRINTNLVDQMVTALKESASMNVVIAVEGTRKKVEYWKTGFYWMAHGAMVPIQLAFVDYKAKIVGLGPSLMPSGDLEADFKIIQKFYQERCGFMPQYKKREDQNTSEPEAAVS